MAPLALVQDTAVALSRRRHSKPTWIIVVVVIASVLLLALIALIVTAILKNRKYSKMDEPTTKTTGQALPRQWTSNSTVAVHQVEERERQGIILKALSDREKSRTMSYHSAATYVVSSEVSPGMSGQNSRDSSLEGSLEEQDISTGLRDDWKEWEAKLLQERSLSFEYHPAVYHPSSREQQGESSVVGAHLVRPSPRRDFLVNATRHPVAHSGVFSATI